MMHAANDARDALLGFFNRFDEECPVQQLIALSLSKTLTIFGMKLMAEGNDFKISKLETLDAMIYALSKMAENCKEAREHLIKDKKND